MGARRRSEVVPPGRVLFVTGKLAEPALRRVLAEMRPAFLPEVAVLKITVAALMTTSWIAKFLTVPPGVDRPELYRVRPAGAVLPRGADWLAETRALREGTR